MVSKTKKIIIPFLILGGILLLVRIFYGGWKFGRSRYKKQLQAELENFNNPVPAPPSSPPTPQNPPAPSSPPAPPLGSKLEVEIKRLKSEGKFKKRGQRELFTLKYKYINGIDETNNFSFDFNNSLKIISDD